MQFILGGVRHRGTSRIQLYVRRNFNKSDNHFNLGQFAHEQVSFRSLCSFTFSRIFFHSWKPQCCRNVTVARTHCSGLHRIAEIIQHPLHMPGSIYNDLAIIKLVVPVDVLPEALPCIPLVNNVLDGKWFSTEWRYVTRRKYKSLNKVR